MVRHSKLLYYLYIVLLMTIVRQTLGDYTEEPETLATVNNETPSSDGDLSQNHTNIVDMSDKIETTVSLTTTTTTTTTTSATTTQTTTTATTETIDTTPLPILQMNHDGSVPEDCSQREKLNKQPMHSNKARLRKCCPLKEGLSISEDNQNDQQCDSTNLSFKQEILSVTLYENCIEDQEINLTLPFEIGNPCNQSLIYNDQDDTMYVLQDGSLLIMDRFHNESYTVEAKYCLDIDNVSGVTYAIVCKTFVEEHLERGHILTIAISMLLSIPCLIFVSYLHITIKELRTLHGLSLSVMSLCLAIGYFLHSVVHISDIQSMSVGYCIQFFILSFFFWYFCLCINVFINIWFKIPCSHLISKTTQRINFAIYFLIAFTAPLIFVILTYQKGLNGMPSYFIKGLTESIRDSQRYFIPPVSTMLFLSFIVMCSSFFGFRKISKKLNPPEKPVAYSPINDNFDADRYCEAKKDAKCISLLGIILIVTWLLEIVTFYAPTDQSYLLLMDFINGLQGVFIMLIFVVIRRRRTAILRWWKDRGDHNIEGCELPTISNQERQS